MVGLLLFLAAANAPQPASSPSQPLDFRAAATARATARIQIIRGVEFGPDHSDVPASALRRSTRLTDYDGHIISAELLEFQ